MPLIGSSTFADFALAEQQNTRVRFDGRVELGSRNLFANPDLKDFASDPDSPTGSAEAGKPEGVVLGSAEAPAGWGVYVHDLEDAESRPTRQTIGPLGMDRDTYKQDGPLVEGPEPADATRRAKIAPPGQSEVEVIARERVGYAGGWRALSYSWIVGPRIYDSDRLTSPAPRTYVELSEGEQIQQPLPQGPPEGATGIALLMTEECDTQNQASTAPLYEQRRTSVERAVPLQHSLLGPFKKERRALEANKTFVGRQNEWPPPKHLYVRAVATLPKISTQLSYSFLSDFGWSSPQGITEVETKENRRNTKLVWYPRRLPPGTKAWRPEFMGSDTLWYALEPRSVNSVASLTTIEVSVDTSAGEGENSRPRFQPEQISRNRFSGETDTSSGDQTGMPDPDSPLEEALVVGAASIEPSRYSIRTFLYDEEGRETPASAPVIALVGAGQTFEVSRPPAGNLMRNAARVSYDPLSGRPEGWEFPGVTPGLVVTEDRRAVYVNDGSGVLVDEDVAVTPKTPIRELNNYVTRFVADFTRYFTGRLDVEARFFEGGPGGVMVGSPVPVASLSGAGEKEIKTRLVPVGGLSPEPRAIPEIEMPAGARQLRLVFRCVGSGTQGQRQFDVELKSMGALAGLAAPPRSGWRRTPVPDIEEDEYEYPTGGRCILLTEPKRLHDDLAGTQRDINAVRYFGPPGTPADRDHLLTGYPTPARAGQVYTISCYAGYEGVTESTGYFRTAFKDARGRTLLVNPPIVPNVLGDQAERRFTKTLDAAPPGSVYLEIISGGGSDGHARAYAFQIEEGPNASPYTNRNAESGWRRVTLDTGLPGIPASSRLAKLGEVAAWLSGGGIFTEEEGITSVDVSFRSTDDDPLGDLTPAWSEWTANFDAVPRLRHWQVEVQLASSDPTQSPVVDRIAVEVLRENPVFLRSDGQEYPGGVQVYDMQAVHGSRIREGFVSDSNERIDRRRGRRRRRVKLSLEAYFFEAVELLTRDLDEGNLAHVVEDPDLGKRYTLMLDPESVEFTRGEGKWEFDRPHHYLHNAEGIEAEIVEEVDLPSEAVAEVVA